MYDLFLRRNLCVMFVAFVAEVIVIVSVIGSSVSAPRFLRQQYSVTISESTARLTNFLNVTADSDATGNVTPVTIKLYSSLVH